MVLAVLTMAVTGVLTMGISVLFWAPIGIALAIGMWLVWSARRKRQMMENRGPDEVKDPLHADRRWPTKGVIDDRLPEP